MFQKRFLVLWAIFWLLVTFPLTVTAWAQEEDFRAWLAELRSEALSSGISQATLDDVLPRIQILPRVTELQQRQPEFRLTVETYLERVVTAARVQKGRELLGKNQELLNDVYHRYGVQPCILVALWGIETSFGGNTGNYPVIDSVATLAFQGRRTAFFRQELLHALRIVDEGHISADQMMGSWAGAMGQVQFMPSSFQSYAVDYDGDGRRDIWNSLSDVFASAANYLARAGWRKDETWGVKALLPAGFKTASAGLETSRSLAQWKTAGVAWDEKAGVCDDASEYWSVITPDKEKGPAYLVNNNYRALLRWNRSHHFAIAAGTLSDRIAER